MKKSRIFTMLVVIAAAISMTSCNRGTGCPSDNMQVDPVHIISTIIK